MLGHCHSYSGLVHSAFGLVANNSPKLWEYLTTTHTLLLFKGTQGYIIKRWWAQIQDTRCGSRFCNHTGEWFYYWSFISSVPLMVSVELTRFQIIFAGAKRKKGMLKLYHCIKAVSTGQNWNCKWALLINCACNKWGLSLSLKKKSKPAYSFAKNTVKILSHKNYKLKVFSVSFQDIMML